jgi:hypothetical protein
MQESVDTANRDPWLERDVPVTRNQFKRSLPLVEQSP